MAEKNPDLKAFLEAEYRYYWDFLKYQYNVRDKYIQFFMLALAALGALLGVVLQSTNSGMIAVVTFVIATFGFLTLLRVLYQRKMTTESKQRLSGIRGKLLGMVEGERDDDLRKILYSTDPSAIEYSGGDRTVMGLIAVITALSGATAATIFFCSSWIFSVFAFVVLLGSILLYKNYKLSEWDCADPFKSSTQRITPWRCGIIGGTLFDLQGLFRKVESHLENLNDRLGQGWRQPEEDPPREQQNSGMLGMVLLMISMILLFLSLTADLIGLGSSPGFGLWQWGGTILGVILVVLGGLLRQRSPSSS